MGVNKNLVSTDGLTAGVQGDDILVGISLANNAVLAQGTPISRDLTQLPGGYAPLDIQPSKLFQNARVSDRGVLATSANAGDLLGVYQGATYTNTSGATQIYVATCKFQGLGRVLAGAISSGTAVTIGAKLVVSSSNIFATVGSRAIGTAVGQVAAYAVNTTVAANSAAGSVTVTPASMVGIISGMQLTIDQGSLQEVVTTTAISATTFTATFANAHTGPFTVQGILSAVGSAIIPVPGSSNTQAVVFADLNGIG
jgi:hypothetical protein